MYGSTEAEPIAQCRNFVTRDLSKATAEGKGLCVGTVVSDISCAVMRDDWGSVIMPLSAQEFSARHCPVNIAGEIVVSGRHVLTGYLDGIGDEATKFKVEDQTWHRTGDAGYFDQDTQLSSCTSI